MLVAPVTCQQSLVDVPASMFCGVATKTTTCGTAPVATDTVSGAVTLLPSPEAAVRVYVVVVCGLTVVLPLGVTEPTPLIETLVAPLVAQLRVTCCPGWTLTGLASKRRICG